MSSPQNVSTELRSNGSRNNHTFLQVRRSAQLRQKNQARSCWNDTTSAAKTTPAKLFRPRLGQLCVTPHPPPPPPLRKTGYFCLAAAALTVGVEHLADKRHDRRVVGKVFRELQLGLEESPLIQLKKKSPPSSHQNTRPHTHTHTTKNDFSHMRRRAWES